MQKKSVLIILSCLMVVALVLSSCGPAAEEGEKGKTVTGKVVEKVTPTVEKEKEEEVVAGKEMVRDSLGRLVEKPQYGGTINVCWSGTSVPGFTPAGEGAASQGSFPIYEPLFKIDVLKGPRGTNELPLSSTTSTMEMKAPCMAESWEQPDLTTIIFHIRKGVHFQDIPPVNGREMTADDVVYSFYEYLNEPKGSWYKNPNTPKEELYQWTTLDKWTVQVKLPHPDPFIIGTMSNDIVVMPREIKDTYGDFNNWRNACGTGPWIVEDVVTGSSITYRRNPNYWEYDPFHKENRLPYGDKLKVQLISDPSTQLAALRSGKIIRAGANWQDAEILLQTNPELNYRKQYPLSGYITYLRTDVPPLSDKRVRQALSLAINHEEFAQDIFKGNAEIYFWPFTPNDTELFTPLEELPNHIRELWEYHPDKAKQLLTEAGYPDGFKLQVTCSTLPFGITDWVSLLKSYWDAVGIETEITVLEWGAWYPYALGHQYPMMAVGGWGLGSPFVNFDMGYRKGHPWNLSIVDDPYLIETWDKIKGTLNAEERNKMWKELGLYALDQMYYINIIAPVSYTFWQPWLKGYAGETQIGRFGASFCGFASYAWIDQELKGSK